MLTARGFWFLLVVAALLALGVATNNPPLVLVCLTLLGWFLGQGLFFIASLRYALPRLRVVRELRDERGPVEGLWAGRTFTVRVGLHGGAGLPHAQIDERVPYGAECAGGDLRA